MSRIFSTLLVNIIGMILSSAGRRDDPLPLSLARASLLILSTVSNGSAYFFHGFSKVAEQATADKT